MASKNKSKKAKIKSTPKPTVETEVKAEELETSNEIVEGAVDTTTTEVKETDKVVEEKTKTSDNGKVVKKRTKKPSKIKQKLRETSSELKKVSWPGFVKALKKTGIVLGFVAIAALLLLGIDKLLSLIYSLLV